jgi:hypothetical protein
MVVAGTASLLASIHKFHPEIFTGGIRERRRYWARSTAAFRGSCRRGKSDRFFDDAASFAYLDRSGVDVMDGRGPEVAVVRRRRGRCHPPAPVLGRAASMLDEEGKPRLETLKGEVEVRWSNGSAA